MYDTVAQYTLDIQAVSCDEMLVDLQDVLQNTSITPEEFPEELRKEMNEKTDCNASVGIGSSILLARVATKKAKPNGVFHLLDGDAEEFFKVRLIEAIETGIILLIDQMAAVFFVKLTKVSDLSTSDQFELLCQRCIHREMFGATSAIVSRISRLE